MAHVQKYKAHDVAKIIGHNSRKFATSSNSDIDPERTELNYSLTPNRGGLTEYEYYKQRLSEVYHLNRRDLVTAASWVVTLPANVNDPETEQKFFQVTYDFIKNHYGEKNILQATVHKDEGRDIARYDRWTKQRERDAEGNVVTEHIGRSHLHVVFCPVVEDNNPQRVQKTGKTERLCCNDVLNRLEMELFHPLLQEALNSAGLEMCRVTNGSTEKGGLTVQQLKHLTDLQQEVYTLREENQLLRDRIRTMESTRTMDEGRSRW